MTKSNLLYQGRLADKMLGNNGSLMSITLADPKRFRWEEYVEDRKKLKIQTEQESEQQRKPNSKQKNDYWRPIPTNMLVIVGSEIHTINFCYVPGFSGTEAGKHPGSRPTKYTSQLKVKVTILRDKLEKDDSGGDDSSESAPQTNNGNQK